MFLARRGTALREDRGSGHDLSSRALRHRQHRRGARCKRSSGIPSSSSSATSSALPTRSAATPASSSAAPPTGVIATDDWDELVELEADCLTYFGDSIGREAEAIADLRAVPRAGDQRRDVLGVRHRPPRHRTARAPRPDRRGVPEGDSSCYFTGIDPGWATTDLAIAALAPADRVDCIRVMELGWWGNYTAEFVCREYFGFGKPPGSSRCSSPAASSSRCGRRRCTSSRRCSARRSRSSEWSTRPTPRPRRRRPASAPSPPAPLRSCASSSRPHRGDPFAIVEHVDCVARDDVGAGWRSPTGPATSRSGSRSRATPSSASSWGSNPTARPCPPCP